MHKKESIERGKNEIDTTGSFRKKTSGRTKGFLLLLMIKGLWFLVRPHIWTQQIWIVFHTTDTIISINLLSGGDTGIRMVLCGYVKSLNLETLNPIHVSIMNLWRHSFSTMLYDWRKGNFLNLIFFFFFVMLKFWILLTSWKQCRCQH